MPLVQTPSELPSNKVSSPNSSSHQNSSRRGSGYFADYSPNSPRSRRRSSAAASQPYTPVPKLINPDELVYKNKYEKLLSELAKKDRKIADLNTEIIQLLDRQTQDLKPIFRRTLINWATQIKNLADQQAKLISLLNSNSPAIQSTLVADENTTVTAEFPDEEGEELFNNEIRSKTEAKKREIAAEISAIDNTINEKLTELHKKKIQRMLEALTAALNQAQED